VAEKSVTIQVGRQAIKLTRPDKILFPEAGITKAELVDYYRRIAPWMVPHLRGRPLSMQRFPDGIGEPGFFQQAAPRFAPEWVRRVTLKKAGGEIAHVVCDNAAILVYLATQACITPHVWLSRADRLDYPDQMMFDLDPSGAEFDAVKSAARGLRDLLAEYKLPAFVKSTGSRGLHVVVPLKRTETFDRVRALARQFAKVLVSRNPGQWTTEQRKGKRSGRVFIDTYRNSYGQTAAPAYAVRARPGAPVAVPLEWEELDLRGLRPDGCSIRDVFERLERIEDPWKDLARHAVAIGKVKIDGTRRVPEET
jgi:bifunctional non-homologous end joining protein LigD